jgi:hypothetical protein
MQLSVLSDAPITQSLIERLSARVDGQIFGHATPLMSVLDESHVIIEGLVVETGVSTGEHPYFLHAIFCNGFFLQFLLS